MFLSAHSAIGAGSKPHIQSWLPAQAAPKSYPVCTIRNTPDKPIHCVVWAKDLLFPRLFGRCHPSISMAVSVDLSARMQRCTTGLLCVAIDAADFRYPVEADICLGLSTCRPEAVTDLDEADAAPAVATAVDATEVRADGMGDSHSVLLDCHPVLHEHMSLWINSELVQIRELLGKLLCRDATRRPCQTRMQRQRQCRQPMAQLMLPCIRHLTR